MSREQVMSRRIPLTALLVVSILIASFYVQHVGLALRITPGFYYGEGGSADVSPQDVKDETSGTTPEPEDKDDVSLAETSTDLSSSSALKSKAEDIAGETTGDPVEQAEEEVKETAGSMTIEKMSVDATGSKLTLRAVAVYSDGSTEVLKEASIPLLFKGTLREVLGVPVVARLAVIESGKTVDRVEFWCVPSVGDVTVTLYISFPVASRIEYRGRAIRVEGKATVYLNGRPVFNTSLSPEQDKRRQEPFLVASISGRDIEKIALSHGETDVYVACDFQGVATVIAEYTYPQDLASLFGVAPGPYRVDAARADFSLSLTTPPLKIDTHLLYEPAKAVVKIRGVRFKEVIDDYISVKIVTEDGREFIMSRVGSFYDKWFTASIPLTVSEMDAKMFIRCIGGTTWYFVRNLVLKAGGETVIDGLTLKPDDFPEIRDYISKNVEMHTSKYRLRLTRGLPRIDGLIARVEIKGKYTTAIYVKDVGLNWLDAMYAKPVEFSAPSGEVIAVKLLVPREEGGYTEYSCRILSQETVYGVVEITVDPPDLGDVQTKFWETKIIVYGYWDGSESLKVYVDGERRRGVSFTGDGLGRHEATVTLATGPHKIRVVQEYQGETYEKTVEAWIPTETSLLFDFSDEIGGVEKPADMVVRFELASEDSVNYLTSPIQITIRDEDGREVVKAVWENPAEPITVTVENVKPVIYRADIYGTQKTEPRNFVVRTYIKGVPGETTVQVRIPNRFSEGEAWVASEPVKMTDDAKTVVAPPTAAPEGEVTVETPAVTETHTMEEQVDLVPVTADVEGASPPATGVEPGWQTPEGLVVCLAIGLAAAAVFAAAYFEIGLLYAAASSLSLALAMVFILGVVDVAAAVKYAAALASAVISASPILKQLLEKAV